jgi:hypothetical protein
MFPVISSEYFNWIEGSFWIVLSIVCFLFYFKVSRPYQSLTIFSLVILFTFGLSDYFEAVYGSFLVPGMKWLFIWKTIDVFGLCIIALWYLKLRFDGKKF